MGFPLLVAAIHSSALAQWQVAQLVGISESRLSRIVRRGVVRDNERQALSRLLGVDEAELFAPGPVVSLNLGGIRSCKPGGEAALIRRFAARGLV